MGQQGRGQGDCTVDSRCVCESFALQRRATSMARHAYGAKRIRLYSALITEVFCLRMFALRCAALCLPPPVPPKKKMQWHIYFAGATA